MEGEHEFLKISGRLPRRGDHRFAILMGTQKEGDRPYKFYEKLEEELFLKDIEVISLALWTN